jgi:hypothetical protein
MMVMMIVVMPAMIAGAIASSSIVMPVPRMMLLGGFDADHMVLLGGGISRFHNWASGNGLFVGRNGPPTRFVALVRSGPFKSTLTEILMPYWGNIYTADASQFMQPDG